MRTSKKLSEALLAVALLGMGNVIIENQFGNESVLIQAASRKPKKSKKSKKGIKKTSKKIKSVKKNKKSKKSKKNLTTIQLLKKLYGNDYPEDYYPNHLINKKIDSYRNHIVKVVQKYIKLNGSLTPKHERYVFALKANKNTRVYEVRDGEDFNDGAEFVEKSNSESVKKGKVVKDIYYDDEDDFLDVDYYTDYTNYSNPKDSYYYVWDGDAYPLNDFTFTVVKK